MVVFDSADLDSTVEGIVDAIWFNQGQVSILTLHVYLECSHGFQSRRLNPISYCQITV